LLGNGSYSAMAGGNGNGATDFSRKQRNSYGTYVIQDHREFPVMEIKISPC